MVGWRTHSAGRRNIWLPKFCRARATAKRSIGGVWAQCVAQNLCHHVNHLTARLLRDQLLYEMIVGLPPFYNENVNIMYERILKAKLTFPPGVSPKAQSFLSGLIERDVKKRLGSNGRDAEELRNHPFFDDLDWELVLNKQIEPEFRPKGSGSEMDIENVDEEFKREVARDTPASQAASKLAGAGSAAFAGFTYNPVSLHLQHARPVFIQCHTASSVSFDCAGKQIGRALIL